MADKSDRTVFSGTGDPRRENATLSNQRGDSFSRCLGVFVLPDSDRSPSQPIKLGVGPPIPFLVPC
jgi:hypothetical protein